MNSRPKEVYSLQAKSDLTPVFVSKVLLKYNHTYLVYILCMATAFILEGRADLRATEHMADNT